MIKSKLPPQSGSSLEAVEPHPWKKIIKSFFIKRNIWGSGSFIDLWLGEQYRVREESKQS